jgi:plasmid stabilization system protein ParE
MSFRFLAPAQTELLRAIAYYAEINAELGVRFEQAIAKAVRAAAAHPDHGTHGAGWCRAFRLVSFTKTAQARYSSSQ